MPIDHKSLRSFDETHFKKKKIPVALKEQLWVKYCGKVYECECCISWCKNTMTAFNYHVGHDVPQSKGGKLHMDNLRPICDRCNYSMGNTYTIRQWDRMVDH
jgi:5-methylcytosine-specific restriction endonuclease McrA